MKIKFQILSGSVILLVIFIFCVSSVYSDTNLKAKQYDVAIIGAGAAGISAARQLCAHGITNIIILEKQDRVGGRVCTKYYDGIPFDTGGTIGFMEHLTTPSVSNSESLYFRQKPVYGYALSNKISWGSSVNNIFSGMESLSSNQAKELGELIETYRFNNPDASLIKLSDYRPPRKMISDMATLDQYNFYEYLTNKYSPETVNLFDTLYRTIYVRHIKSFSAVNGSYLFVNMVPSIPKKGNMYHLENMLRNLPVQLQLNSEVLSLSNQKDKVLVENISNGITNQILAGKVIITTPAPVCRKIIMDLPDWKSQALSELEYGSAITVTIFTRSKTLPDFSYVLTPGKISKMILNITPENTNNYSVYALYVSEVDGKIGILDKSSDEIIKTILTNYSDLIPDFREDNVAFADVTLWKNGFPITKPGFYTRLLPLFRKNTGNIYYAGDYTQYIYGIEAAVQSGIQAADQIAGK